GGRVAPTAPRVIGTGLAIAGVLVSVAGGLGGGGSAWLVVAPFMAGAAMAWQAAVHGLVRAATRSAVAATFLNFLVGTVVLVAVAAVSVALQGWPRAWPPEPWYYVGGLFGVVYIALASVLVRTAGVLLLSMSNVAG